MFKPCCALSVVSSILWGSYCSSRLGHLVFANASVQMMQHLSVQLWWDSLGLLRCLEFRDPFRRLLKQSSFPLLVVVLLAMMWLLLCATLSFVPGLSSLDLGVWTPACQFCDWTSEFLVHFWLIFVFSAICLSRWLFVGASMSSGLAYHCRFRAVVPGRWIVALVLLFVRFPGCRSQVYCQYDSYQSQFALGSSLSCDFCHLHANRIGEADHPGPPPLNNSRCVIALTNPTSIVSKASVYASLQTQHQVDIFCAAETAATKPAQRMFGHTMRQYGCKTIWSPPVCEKIVRTDGQASLRGQASGVAVVSKHPIRSVPHTIPSDLAATCRIIHTVVTSHDVEFQLLVLYGLAASGTNAQNKLLLTAAVEAAQTLPLPFMIAGDMNCDPLRVLGSEFLQAHQLSDLTTLHTALLGTPMPPTCRGVTTPDNALVSSQLRELICGVSVLPDHHFDCHKVVLVTIDCKPLQKKRFQCKLPSPWNELTIDFAHIAQDYQTALKFHGKPSTIEQWGQVVEHAVDLAYQATQSQNADMPGLTVQPLPKKFRGRCQPRAPQPVKPVLLARPARRHEYHPGEIRRAKTRDKVKQVRRAQSLLRILTKYQSLPMPETQFRIACYEWQALLRSKAMGPCFVFWCQSVPELGPPSMTLPDIHYLCTLAQMLKFDADAAAAEDAKFIRDMTILHNQMDAKHSGHSKAFAHLKDNYSFDALTNHESTDAIVVPQDDGTAQVWCENPTAFSALHHVQVAEHTCTIVGHDLYSLMVRPITQVELPEECTVTQTVEITDTTAICDRLRTYWAPFWEQELNTEVASEDFEILLNQLPMLPPPALDIHSDEVWLAAVKELKVPSARGIDGIAAAELQQLPPEAILDLRDILTSYTAFPTWMMQAFTSPIPKVPEQPQIHQLRPITVLAQIYRLWSRVICRQLLKHLGNHMPESLTGLLYGRGPLDSALRQQFWLESCHHSDIDASGLCLDLVKCYNTINRQRVRELFLRCHLPAEIVQVWFESLQQLQRIWTIQGSCSEPYATVTGLPEGDSWSVVGMVLLDLLWVSGIDLVAPGTFVSAYADNLGWAATQLAMHQPILDVTCTFTRALGMQIDWRKTWCWGTSSALAKQLQQLLQQSVPDATVDQHRAAMDLGSQMTYRGPPILGTFRKRLERAQLRLSKLKYLKLPLPSKTTLLKCGIYPLAFYGLAILPVGSQHFDQFRPLCADALFGSSASRNSAIALLATPNCLDPLEYAIISVLRVVKRFLLQLPPEQVTLFCHIVSRHDGTAHKCKGPAGTLAYWLSKLGWSMDNQGYVLLHAFHKIHLPTASMQLLTRWVRTEWQTEVFQFLCSCSALKHLRFDMICTRQVIATLPAAHQPSIILECAGAFQTEGQKAKWAADADGTCLHCGQLDSRFHRFHECPATLDLRAPYAPMLQYLLDTGSLLHEFPALAWSVDAEALMLAHTCHPEAAILPEVCDKLTQLGNTTSQLTFFTDGSLQLPEDPRARFGAYSVVVDLCCNDRERAEAVQTWKHTGIRPVTFSTLAKAKTTGEQRIYRSELFALVMVVEHFASARVFCDCASALQTAWKCQGSSSLLPLMGMEDFDLVIRLWKKVRCGTYEFCKVEAHAKITQSMDDLLIYLSWGNQHANDAAIDTCWNFEKDLVQEALCLHAERKTEIAILKQVYELQLSLHKARAQLEANNVALQAHRHVLRPTGPTPVEVLRSWTIGEQWNPPAQVVSLLPDVAWGHHLTLTLVDWMRQISWPVAKADDDPGITFFELAVSYIMFSGYFVPIKRVDTQGTEYLQAIETWSDVELHVISFSDLSNGFATWLAQTRKAHCPAIWPEYAHGTCRSLYRMGSSFQSRGIVVRPVLPNQQLVTDLLVAYVRRFPECGPVPEMTIGPLLPIMRSEIAAPWNRLQKRASAAARKVKQLHDAGQRRLSFG